MKILVLATIALALSCSACTVISGTGSVLSTGISVAGTLVETGVGVAGSAVRGLARAISP